MSFHIQKEVEIMEKCSICMKIIVEENKIHAYTDEGEGCCKVCWDWLKANVPLKVEGEEE